jgi:hypothetical protein
VAEFERVEVDYIAITDAVETALEYARDISDSMEITDAAETAMVIAVVLSADAVVISDAVERGFELWATITDTITITDAVDDPEMGHNIIISASISITDVVLVRMYNNVHWRYQIKLAEVPKFQLIKETAGQPAAEATALSLANFPMSHAFRTEGADVIAFYYELAGGVAADKVTVQLLIYDHNNPIPKWVIADTATDLAPNTIVELDTGGASIACIRIHGVTLGGTRGPLEGRAAFVQHQPHA